LINVIAKEFTTEAICCGVVLIMMASSLMGLPRCARNDGLGHEVNSVESSICRAVLAMTVWLGYNTPSIGGYSFAAMGETNAPAIYIVLNYSLKFQLALTTFHSKVLPLLIVSFNPTSFLGRCINFM